MFRSIKFIAFLSFLLLVISGCASRVQTVFTYDEQHDAEMKEQYSELKETLVTKYPDDSRAMKEDPLYDEYVSLNARYGLSLNSYSTELRNQFRGIVDLDGRTIEYGEETINYEYKDDQVTITNNNTDLLDDTFVRMVGLANKNYEDDNSHNRSLLISAGFLPIFTFTVGVIAWFKPRWVWYTEGGFRYKDAEPSSTALIIIRIQSIIAFGLTAFLFFLLYNQML